MEDQEQQKMKVVVLAANGKNYRAWKYKVELLLGRYGVSSLMTDAIPETKSEDWLKKNSKAKIVIGLSIDDSYIASVENLQYAKELWDFFKASYEKPCLSNQVSFETIVSYAARRSEYG